ncbi:MAG: hypothetical protein ACLRYE_15615 [Gemmiger formicilis]|uniref:hypothetical protein n=1 Tax=Gemmiger formicilis TaxID=745368 RepID=UPI0039A35E5F
MKIERKYMAHYLNAAFGSGDASYTRLGSDLEEYSPELTANVEKKSNIVGETTVTINGYQKQGEVSPYYAEPGDPLFERLQAIIDGDLVLDDLKTDIVEVKLWDKDTAGRTPQCARNATSRSSATVATPPVTRSRSTCITPASRRRARLTRQPRSLRRRDRQRAAAGRLPLIRRCGAAFSLRAKSRLRRLRSDTRLRAQPLGEGFEERRVRWS